MIDVGSSLRVSIVDLAVTPKPCQRIERGTIAADGLRLTTAISAMLKITTPWCSGVSSVIRPRCAFTTWLPYRKGISPLGLIQTCDVLQRHLKWDIPSQQPTLYFAYFARYSSEVICSLNLPDLENLPKQTPTDMRWSRLMDVAMRRMDSET